MKETVTFPWKSPLNHELELHLHWWKNKYGTALPPRGYVWIVHGLGEHGGRYDELANFLTQLGFDVLAPDHVGHGLNRGYNDERSRLSSMKTMRSGLNAALRYWMTQGVAAKSGAATKPWYVMGHSLGGLLTLSWILKARQEGFDLEFATAAFVSAAPLELRMPVAEWKKSLAHKIQSLAPHFEMNNDISLDYLSVEAANKAHYSQDSLVHPYASPELFLSLIDEIDEVIKNPSDIEIPLAIAVGELDPIVNPVALKKYYESLATHKSFVEMPGVRHEIFNDISKREIYKIIAEWFL